MEWKMVRFVMILSSCGSLFQNLAPAPKKVLSPAQTSFTLRLQSSILPEEWSCQPGSHLEMRPFICAWSRSLSALKKRTETFNLT